MNTSPHYLLFSEASCCAPAGKSWRFVLQDVESNRRLAVSDQEPAACGERLELLAVVRGLEALDGPARVTLVTRSRYVSRGIKHGLTEWRANEWRWERFGRIVPVKDCDLWQRIDRALLFHEVECQAWQFEESAEAAPVASQPEAEVAPQLREVSPPVGEKMPRRVVSRKSAPATDWPHRADLASSRQPSKKWQRSLLGRALHWIDSLRGLGIPSRPAIQGAV
ncbi:RNase H family protein [Bythopirellula polymerisocia]|uniref:Ribonuclease HI n=1 Tax=Bythopirellula polymerisocia TaxID=2528003 RepID=A0A5C6CQI2_9BACT|nr:RNase H family protein [Bythopirellula polymerisocia]TWU25774.1 Ribonuclease HI [Bythopirellula polymerisocia]